MIAINAQSKILLAIEPIDFRKGIDSLAAVCRQALKQDPFCGAMFVFCNRSKTALKILCYDGQGYWLCMKRLSEGKFQWWPKSKEEMTLKLTASQLLILLYNGNPDYAKIQQDWRKIELEDRPIH
jgi:transposase